MTMLNSQKINNDPTPLYTIHMIARNGSAAEWAMRSDSEDVAIEVAMNTYPKHDVHSVSVIYNRPEFDNTPNPVLEAFRAAREHSVTGSPTSQVAAEWLASGVLAHLGAPVEWGHVLHARKVLERLARLA